MSITINGNGTVTGISVGGLPDGIVDTDMIANTVSLGGMAMVDQWRLATEFVYTQTNHSLMLVTGGWARNSNNFTQIGTGMTESSGVFTFPATGIYKVDARWSIQNEGSGISATANRYVHIRAEISTDGGSNYYALHDQTENFSNQGQTFTSTTSDFVVDVTNASNFKLRWQTGSNNTFSYVGTATSKPGNFVISSPSNNAQVNSLTFMKLGDT